MHIPAKLLGRKFQGVAAREQIKLVQMFKMAESDGEFACLNTSSSHQGSCQNTPKIWGPWLDSLGSERFLLGKYILGFSKNIDLDNS